jgi:hypothetical protein
MWVGIVRDTGPTEIVPAPAVAVPAELALNKECDMDKQTV